MFKIIGKYMFSQVGTLESVRPFKDIPRPPEIPFLGHWHLFKLGYYDSLKYQNVLKQWHTKYGPIVCENIGWKKPIIHIFDVQDIKTVYKNEDKSPDVLPLNEFLKLYRNKEKIFAGLGQTNGDDWYRVKSAIRDLMMKATSAETYFLSVNNVTDDLIKQIQSERNYQNEIPNLSNLIGRWNIEVGGKIVLDKRLDCLSGPNQELARKIMQISFNVFKLSAELKFALPFYNHTKTPKLLQLMKQEAKMHEIILPLIQDVISKVKKTSEQATDNFKFMRTLLKQPGITEGEAIIVASTLLIDGLSTTNPVLFFNLYSLATNQEVQNKVYEEIKNTSIINNEEEKMDANLLRQLPYLKAVIKETFRMYPNGTEVSRINKEPFVLSNYQIPAGSQLSLNMFVNYRSSKYFSQPNKFIPERWMRDSELYSISNSFILSPFGYGVRTCAGRRFANQDLLISLYKILKNFRVTYSGSEPLDIVFRNLLFPRKNIPIQFVPRANK